MLQPGGPKEYDMQENQLNSFVLTGVSSFRNRGRGQIESMYARKPPDSDVELDDSVSPRHVNIEMQQDVQIFGDEQNDISRTSNLNLLPGAASPTPPLAQAPTQLINEAKLAGLSRNSIIGRSSQAGQNMRKSLAGFDIGVDQAVGQFYSSVRQAQQGEKPNFVNTESMTGEQYVKALVEQQESRYQKKFAFERGQYHQCIPNPQNEKQMITVQLVTRALEGRTNMQSVNLEGAFVNNDQQNLTKEITTVSQQFQRYNLVPKDQTDNLDMGEGEDMGDGKDASQITDAFGDRTMNQDLSDLYRAATSDQDYSRVFTKYMEVSEDLYKPNALNEEVDQLAGISAEHYANISKSQSQKLAIRAYMNAKDFAVVAFWDLKEVDDTFKCTRFFIVPNPMKRTINESEGTKLEQVLYSSPHNKEVFLFFKGYEVQQLDEDMNPEHKLQIAFLKLDIDIKQTEWLSDTRLIINHCREFSTIREDSVLASFIEYLNVTEFAD